MYKSIDTPAQNRVNVVGILTQMAGREGKAKTGRSYCSCKTTVRVEQTYGGNTEISEIPVDFIAMKDKSNGDMNPVYESLRKFSYDFHPAMTEGIDGASRVSITGSRNARLSENMWVGRNGTETIVSNFQIGGSFMRPTRAGVESTPCATFDIEIFILNMERELNSAGEETGRLKIRGGIVQWGRKLDCLDFFVENKDAVDFIERNYSINETAHFVGRVRCTSTEMVSMSENTWGESIPTSTSRNVRELIITGPGAGGENGPYDEEQSYDPEEVRILMADRNARREQLKMGARATEEKKKIAKATYDWEE